jgi:ABC-type sugar transport system ATPase subunit
MASVSIAGLCKDKPSALGKGGPNRILHDISMEIADGEFLVLVGPSGCGKTTLLRCIAGLEEPSAGELAIDGKRVNDVPPQARDIAMVFQSYALYPHMTVAENLSFGLKMRHTPPGEIKKLVEEAAQMLEIGHLAVALSPGALGGAAAAGGDGAGSGAATEGVSV